MEMRNNRSDSSSILTTDRAARIVKKKQPDSADNHRASKLSQTVTPTVSAPRIITDDSQHS